MKAQEKSFDFILCSATGDFPLGPYLKLLKPRTKFCLVGLPAVAQPLRFEPFDIVSGEKEIVGSMIGSAADQRAMLEFSAKHKCFPQCEVIDFANVSGRQLRAAQWWLHVETGGARVCAGSGGWLPRRAAARRACAAARPRTPDFFHQTTTLPPSRAVLCSPSIPPSSSRAGPGGHHQDARELGALPHGAQDRGLPRGQGGGAVNAPRPPPHVTPAR